MSFDDFKRVEELPIFPLSTVLFPGAVLPLHVFEERYKAMINYAIENQRLFGLSYRKDADVGIETPPDIGSVGCMARIETVLPLEEGKMNLLSMGVVRYKVVSFLQTDPFLIARVEIFTDDLEPDEDMPALFEELMDICKKFLAAAQTLNGLEPAISPELPEEPEAFSLLIASALPIDNDRKQRLLEMISTKLRLTRLRSYVTEILSDYNERLRIQSLAKSNGHGKAD
ncbi:MAG: LON peptidase substrate-binding domain-containing protein [Blastocatellia bacterium]|nr:LON peptidase substrate-binding domain-containing protein [Blastocatellia bacterium]